MMRKKIIILSDWESKENFKKLKSEAETLIQFEATFSYLFCVKNHKLIEELPQLANVIYISKKDFSFFGKLQTPVLKDLLIHNPKESFLVIASESPSKLLLKTLKFNQLMSIGIAMKSLPQFDVSFKNTTLNQGKFFQQMNNYLKYLS